MTTLVDEPRETSGATTSLLLNYVLEHGGEQALAETLRRADVPATADDLLSPSHWCSYDTRIRLFAAATEVLGPATMRQVGAEALANGISPALVLVVRALGSPRQVFRQLPRAVAKFSTTSTMEIIEAGATSASVRFTLHEGFQHSRLDCDYVQGLLSMVPTVFGLQPATVLHDECESDGHPACIYHVTWERRLRLWSRRARDPESSPELVALRSQLRILQSAAGDLVASGDVQTVLKRIVARAAEAVLAPAYLLAVHDPDGGAPLIHSAGLPSDRVAVMAATLLADGDLGPHAVAVDVASAGRVHGRLAAVYGEDYGALGDEEAMLAAYAGHAAAALDLLIARDQARSEADRAGALLNLAHELAAASEADAVCTVVARALPGIVGCKRATVLLWDPAAGSLRTQANVGMTPDNDAVMRSTVLPAEDTPELVGMLTDRGPRILQPHTASPRLRELLEQIGSTAVVAVPLLSGTTFLGVAAVGWTSGTAPTQLDGDVLARLQGVGDQASTALQKARLLETVRHQATHDALTGLPNRMLFLDRLERALAATRPGGHLAVLFCDLDRFKQVNDTLGHAAGDELLRQVSARLRSTIRPGDTVGRLSGDEFAIILPGLVAPEDAASLADRVVACFDQPFRLEGTDVTVGTSVGVAVLDPAAERSADQLLRKADAAMYRHKQGRRRSAHTR